MDGKDREMQCIDPGLVTPDDLVAYATGEPDARVAVHVAACDACAVQASDYAAVDELLRGRLYRVDCPPARTLGELALELLEPQAALAVRAHLALCTHCAGELSTLSEALRADPMEALAPAPGRLARIVARLLPAPGAGMAYAGVRGGENSASRTYEAGDLSVSLTLDAETGGMERRWTLLGLVLAESDELPAGTPVALLRNDQPAAEATLDDLGNFVLPGIAAGAYSLELTLHDRIVVVDGLDVGEAPA